VSTVDAKCKINHALENVLSNNEILKKINKVKEKRLIGLS